MRRLFDAASSMSFSGSGRVERQLKSFQSDVDLVLAPRLACASTGPGGDASFDFSARLSSDGVPEEDTSEGGTEIVPRARQTSLISLSSKSRHNGMMPSRSSDQRTSTRSSR